MHTLDFIAGRLRQLREKHGLTQEQVAALLGTDLRWYQRVESREKDIRASTIDRLAAAFGLTPEKFLGDTLPDSAITSKLLSTPHRQKRRGRGNSAK